MAKNEKIYFFIFLLMKHDKKYAILSPRHQEDIHADTIYQLLVQM